MFSVVYFSCKTDMEKIKKIAEGNDHFIEAGNDVEVLYSDSAKVRIKLTAGKVIRYLTPEPSTEMPNGVKVYFYNDSMQTESRLTANYAISYDNKDEMIARNNVIVVNLKGKKLETEELIWDQKKEKIYSNKFVKITTEDEIIFGEGMESNQTFTEYKIKKIKGTINVKQNPGVKNS